MRHSLSGTTHLLIVVALVWVSAMATGADTSRRAQGPAPAAAALPAGEGSDVVRRHCLTCHGVDLIAQQRLSRDEWGREVDKMVAWGAGVTGPERPVLLDYLAGQFGKAAQPPVASLAATDLLRLRCLVCHDRTLIDQQRLTRDGWRREIDKMLAWGAQVTEAEKTALIESLASR
jgi:hypothetical protein